MFNTGDRSSPLTPVRDRSLHSMISAASKASLISGVMRIDSTSGNGWRKTGGMASVTTMASLPIARSASAIDIAEPMASPSGRWCEATTNFCPVRMRSTNSAGGFVILDRGGVLAVGDGINHLGIVDGPRRLFGVDLLDDLLDAILRRHRLVEDELHFGRAAQRQPLAQQVTHVAGHALERLGGLLALGGVPEDGPVDSRQ